MNKFGIVVQFTILTALNGDTNFFPSLVYLEAGKESPPFAFMVGLHTMPEPTANGRLSEATIEDLSDLPEQRATPLPSAGEPAAQQPLASSGQLVSQGVSKEFPQSWGYANGGKSYVHQELEIPQVSIDDVRGLVGAKDAEHRLTSLASAKSHSSAILIRKETLASTLLFLQSVSIAVSESLRRLQASYKKTPRVERVRKTEGEPNSLKDLSLVQKASLLKAYFWFSLFAVGVFAEVYIGTYNVIRAELYKADWFTAICLALLPFIGTFVVLSWLDPADIDRNRPGLYRWFTRAALGVTLLAIYLFASKLGALREINHADSNASYGPAFKWIICSIQASFAISIYLAHRKLGEAWWQFLGYEIVKTAEGKEISLAIESTKDELISIAGISGELRGAFAAIPARERAVFEQLRILLGQLTQEEAKQKELAENEAQIAANTARAKVLRSGTVM